MVRGGEADGQKLPELVGAQALVGQERLGQRGGVLPAALLLGAADELPRKAPMKLVFWISEAPSAGLPDATLTEAVRAHLEYEVARLDRQIQQHMRRGQVFLLFGLTVLVVFLTLAELTSAMPTGHLRQIVREGLVITGWVAMWRPIEVLLYDWWPLVEERRVYERLYEAPIEVRHEPDAASATSA